MIFGGQFRDTIFSHYLNLILVMRKNKGDLNFCVVLPYMWGKCPPANFSATDKLLFNKSVSNNVLIIKNKENLFGT